MFFEVTLRLVLHPVLSCWDGVAESTPERKNPPSLKDEPMGKVVYNKKNGELGDNECLSESHFLAVGPLF